MKKIISVIALVLCLTMVLGGCNSNQDPNAPEGYKLVSAENAGYQLFVPSEWIEGLGNLSTSAYYSRGADATSISVTASGASLSGNETVDTWWDRYQKDFALEFDNFELISTEEAQLGGVDGKKFTFKATKGFAEAETTAEGETTEPKAQQYNFICIAVVKDAYIYFMLYTSTPEYYETHLDTLSNVVSYFKFA